VSLRKPINVIKKSVISPASYSNEFLQPHIQINAVTVQLKQQQSFGSLDFAVTNE
jgi:hypothetical protein